MNTERSVTGGLFLLIGIMLTILIILLAIVGIIPAHAQEPWEDWGYCSTKTVGARQLDYKSKINYQTTGGRNEYHRYMA